MTGWRTTVDGEDVYTEDGEWFWFHDDQGWFHRPGLALMPPPPPANVRARTWADRMLTGWPKNPLLGLNPRYTRMRDVGFINWATCWFMRVVLVYMWVYKVGLDWGLHNVARSHQKFWYGIHVTMGWGTDNSNLSPMEPRWWTMDVDGTDHDSRNVVLVWVMIVITLAFFYLLYMTVVFQVDPHKGYAMLGAIAVASAVGSHRRHERQRDQQMARDIAAELDRRHHRGRNGFGF